MFFRSSPGRSDISVYREGYPGKRDDPKATRNLEFYAGKIVSIPDRCTIEQFHTKWWGDIRRLEQGHGYIQWLFPIREHGLNMEAQELMLHEADAIRRTPILRARIIRSFALMLDFYGYRLVDARTGLVERKEDPRTNFRNFYSHPHNFLRVTRIFKCLGEVGLEPFKYCWMRCLIIDACQTGLLSATGESLRRFWVETVKDDRMRAEFKNYMGTCTKAGSRAPPPPMPGLEEAMAVAARLNDDVMGTEFDVNVLVFPERAPPAKPEVPPPSATAAPAVKPPSDTAHALPSSAPTLPLGERQTNPLQDDQADDAQ